MAAMRTYRDFGIEIPGGRVSGNVKAFCPRCHELRSDKRDKSLSVNLDRGVWNCHHCGWSGGLGGDGEDRARWMREQWWYREPPARRDRKAYRRPAPRQDTGFSERALAWFRSRGISPETLAAMRVTEGMEFMPQKGREANTVQFNYYRDGELVNTKFRTGDKCFKMCKGAELLPYGIDNIKGQKECVITEGEMDALSFYECGRHDVVSVPAGANANLSWLDDYVEGYFDDKETIYVASDTDAKGTLLKDELVRRFGAERCRVVGYGEGCKDANEHLVRYGRESLAGCLLDAPETRMEGVFSVLDFEPSLDALYEHGMRPGVTIGHETFDRFCSFETRRLCVVTGIPGSGKSEFIDEIAERLNVRHGWRFAYFSPENAPLSYHASKLIEKFTGKRFGSQTLPRAEYEQAKRHLAEDFYFISPEEDFRLSTILERAKFLVRRRGVKGLVIDPYNRLEDECGGQSETRYVSRQLDEMTGFAQRNDVLVILMAHPTKQPRNKDGVIEPPTLYDISGSAHFYNKADFGIVVHRNREEGTVSVFVRKVKFRHLGECGEAMFRYNARNGRYVPLTGSDANVVDDSNHLVEGVKEREREAADGAMLPFGAWDDGDGAPF